MNGPSVILFDGVCRLCSGWVRFVIARDRGARFRFAPLDSETAARLLAGHDESVRGADSIVLIDEGRAYLRSTAALRIVRRLGGAWPLAYGLIVVPRPLRDALYDLVARNRYRWFGRRDACLVPSATERDRFLG